MALTAAAIKGFSESILASRYDEPAPTPNIHMEWWEMCCSGAKEVAIAAPRNHAKSTAITHAYVLASILFRQHKYVIIVSDTEEQAVEFLGDIKEELKNNDVLVDTFGVAKVEKDATTDVIVRMNDGYKFRLIAKGSEQKLRGRKWLGMRPSLIIGDDLENDEIVMNDDRRRKFRRWFFRSAKQALRDAGEIRVVGTILHEDSLLQRLMNNRVWKTRLYKAHNSFDDFSNLLWPEKHSEESLRAKRQEFIEDGDSEGYSQEYLNDPFDHSDTFLRKQDFLDIDEEHRNDRLTMYGSADLAISLNQRAAFTAIGAAGIDSRRKMQVRDVRRKRMESDEIVNEIFSVVERWGIHEGDGEFFLESENIAKTLGPQIYEEMRRRKIYFTLTPITPSKDKLKRAVPLQRMMRAGQVEFDKETEWYPALEMEGLRFPKSTYKDQIDMLSQMASNINRAIDPMTDQEAEDEEYEEEFMEFGTDVNSEICAY